jgi:predicted enzyme related to lactoylglutathione lyase
MAGFANRTFLSAKMLLLWSSLAFAGGASSAAQTSPGAQAPGIALGARPLQQVALTTRDLPRAVAFYRDVLGLPLMFESNGMAFFNIAGTRLMIAKDKQRPEGRPTSIIYFDVADFDLTRAALVQRQVSLEGPVETVQSTDKGDLKLQQFRDPDGNALAIMALVPAARAPL